MFDVRCLAPLALALALSGTPAAADDAPGREQALQALRHPSAEQRLIGVLRLADIGTMVDVEPLLARMADADPTIRQVVIAAVWRIWSRSGDPAIDALYEQGIDQMQAGNLPKALEIFSDIIRRKPEFAEAWNKRATLYFLLDEYTLSMKDCDEVLIRNPSHFGAMSGYAQMLAERDQPERALDYLERAYKINPNMTSAEFWIPELKRRIEAKRKKST